MQQLDQALLLAMNFDAGAFWDNFFWIVSQKLTWAPLYAILVYLLYRRYGLRQGTIALVLCIIMVALCDQTANFFKEGVAKFRPTHTVAISDMVHTVNGYRGGLYGTVSAHAAISFGIATYVGSLLRNKWLLIGLYFWAALVAYSRIYLGVHFPADILFGIVDGLVMAYICTKLFSYAIRSREKL